MTTFSIASPTSGKKKSKPIDWKACFICQDINVENLVKPFERPGFATHPEKSSYHTTASNLKGFQTLDEFNFDVSLRNRLQMYNTEENLEEAFIKNHAVFHKRCLNNYDRQKLKRKQKAELELNDITSPKTRRHSEQSQNFSNFCFFCDDGSGSLHRCETIHLNNQVYKIAEALSDTKLLAKLSEGDMIATEAKYHLNCLTNLYNTYRQHTTSKSSYSSEIELYKGIAFSEVINFMTDIIANSVEGDVPVFKLFELVKMYKGELEKYGLPSDNVHTSRFKQRVLSAVPYLSESKSKKVVLLTLRDEIGSALMKCSDEDDGIILSKAAHIIRRSLLDTDEIFDGNVSREKQTNSVPSSLVQLIELILQGEKAQHMNLRRISVNIAQLIRFNSLKQKRRKDISEIRHSRTNEPPLPVLIGLRIHATTRKKKLVNRFANEGLCITYQRVKKIQKEISNQLCSKYHEEGIVCPPSLEQNKEDVLISAAIDNIDFVSSSTTSKSSFHGTSITIFQHPTVHVNEIPFKLDTSSHGTQCHTQLPSSYTNIKPTKGGKPEPSPCIYPSDNFPSLKSIDEDANPWLNTLLVEGEVPIEDRMSFSAFHSKASGNIHLPKTIDVLMPLLKESVNSAAMVRHCMGLIKELIKKVNPEQESSVITGDQPVYALGKQVQWMYQDVFADDVWMMGPLHIEMALICVIGDFLEGSGWVEVFKLAMVNTPGRVESFLKGTKVKRSRYAHQLSLTSLIILARDAFKEQTDQTSYADWKVELSVKSINAKYWFTVIELEILLFMFIKSIRDTDFDLFVRCIQDIVPWMFALDHIHYSRWMSVFLFDLQKIPEQHPIIFQHFLKGKFTVKKTNRVFSNMGEDQAHEQNNKKIKVDGGAIGILENETALLEWAVSGPQIAKILDMDAREDCITIDEDTFQYHHEDTDIFEKTFRKEQNAVVNAFNSFGNPFKEKEPGLINIVTRHILDDTAAQSVHEARGIGLQKSTAFLEDRIKNQTISLYDHIKMNKLPLFRKKVCIRKKGKDLVFSLKKERQLYANLYVSAQSRNVDLDKFFEHEQHIYPPSLSEFGGIRSTVNKSDFLTCLEKVREPDIEPPYVQAHVIDGPGMVHANAPYLSKTYGEYCLNELKKKVDTMSPNVDRIDIVFDVYREITMKGETRKNRGADKGVRISVQENTRIFQNFSSFLRNDENKTELFSMAADLLTTVVDASNITLVCTRQEIVVSNSQTLDLSTLNPCTHEEADTRIFLHVNDISQKGLKKINVIATDTDVVVIALYAYHYLNLDELWIDFGRGKNQRYYPIHEYAKLLGKEKCDALPFWYALTGCDTVSQFAGRGKKTAWSTWNSFPEATESFKQLSMINRSDEADIKVVERFVILMYDRTSDLSDINKCRQHLFTKKSRPVEGCPPTKDALLQHIKRARLQSNIWISCMEKNPSDVDFNAWGWIVDDDGLRIRWTTLPEASKVCPELISCGKICKKRCVRCKCVIAGLPCTQLCDCNGGCENASSDN